MHLEDYSGVEETLFIDSTLVQHTRDRRGNKSQHLHILLHISTPATSSRRRPQVSGQLSVQ